jgi:hypothetical protein
LNRFGGDNALRRKVSIQNRDSKCEGIVKVWDTGSSDWLSLQFDLAAKFDHAAGWNAEEFGHGKRIAM